MKPEPEPEPERHDCGSVAACMPRSAKGRDVLQATFPEIVMKGSDVPRHAGQGPRRHAATAGPGGVGRAMLK
jgi:hypothetical protein